MSVASISRPLRVSPPNAAGRGSRPGKEDAVTITNNPSVRQVLAAVVADPQYPALARRPLLSWPHIGSVVMAYGVFATSEMVVMLQVPGDGVGAGIEAFAGELDAQGDDEVDGGLG